jgi:hypothetical protein
MVLLVGHDLPRWPAIPRHVSTARRQYTTRGKMIAQRGASTGGFLPSAPPASLSGGRAAAQPGPGRSGNEVCPTTSRDSLWASSRLKSVDDRAPVSGGGPLGRTGRSCRLRHAYGPGSESWGRRTCAAVHTGGHDGAPPEGVGLARGRPRVYGARKACMGAPMQSHIAGERGNDA